MKANTIIILITGLVIAGFIVMLVITKRTSLEQTQNVNNVSVVDGKQFIEISAKGGYLPRKSVAQAGIPTIIRFKTRGTFDCSSSIRIPSMNISKVLPNTGSTDIDLGVQPAGVLQGACGMGMYPFEVEFQG
jgi:plastocyanin domain-containing protein